MRVRRWAALMAPCLVFGCFLVLGPVSLHQARAAGAEEQRLLELINGYRQEHGLGPLVPSGVLSASAEHHSEDMAAHGFFSHSTRESSYYPDGSSFVDRATREGYPANVYLGENIAMGQQTAEEVFDAWRNSPEHDAAMLGEQYSAAGIGHAGSYWTADFGSVAGTPTYPEPYAGRIVEPAAEQTTGERGGDDQPTDDERIPEKRAQIGEGPSEAGDAPMEEDEPADGETTTTGGTSALQQGAGEQATDEEAQAAGDTSDLAPGGETAPRTASSPRPPTGGITVEQYAGETGPVEVPSPSGEELDTGGLDAGMIAQEITGEEGLLTASPAETEAMESVLTTREAIPEDLVRQASSAPERPVEEPAAGSSPEASDPGASDGDVPDIMPVAKKKLSMPDGASPIKPLVGGFLLLCGLLVHRIARRQGGDR